MSIQLSRLINALRSILKQSISNNLSKDSMDKMHFIKNKFDLFILLSSTLYEVTKTYKKDIEGKISINILSDENKEKHNLLISKYDRDNLDDFGSIIKDIRDKLSFHFDLDIAEDFIKNNDLDEEENYILIGSSEQIIDTFFCLPDDIALTYIQNKYFKGKIKNNFNELEEKVGKEALFLSEYFEYLIIDLLKNHYYKTLEPW